MWEELLDVVLAQGENTLVGKGWHPVIGGMENCICGWTDAKGPLLFQIYGCDNCIH